MRRDVSSLPLPSPGSVRLKPYTRSAASWSPSLAARDGFKRSYLAQAVVDVIAIALGVVFVSTFAVGAGCAALFILLEICRAYSGAG